MSYNLEAQLEQCMRDRVQQPQRLIEQGHCIHMYTDGPLWYPRFAQHVVVLMQWCWRHVSMMQNVFQQPSCMNRLVICQSRYGLSQ